MDADVCERRCSFSRKLQLTVTFRLTYHTADCDWDRIWVSKSLLTFAGLIINGNIARMLLSWWLWWSSWFVLVMWPNCHYYCLAELPYCQQWPLCIYGDDAVQICCLQIDILIWKVCCPVWQVGVCRHRVKWSGDVALSTAKFKARFSYAKWLAVRALWTRMIWNSMVWNLELSLDAGGPADSAVSALGSELLPADSSAPSQIIYMCVYKDHVPSPSSPKFSWQMQKPGECWKTKDCGPAQWKHGRILHATCVRLGLFLANARLHNCTITSEAPQPTTRTSHVVRCAVCQE